LDYDGSLVRFTEDYKAAKPPKSLLGLLEDLSADPCNEIVVVSGRSGKDLGDWLGHLPISLIGEHGAAVRKAGNTRWHTVDRAEAKWRRAILPILTQYAEMTPGAHVETKLHSLVWHYRASPVYYAQKYAVTIKRVLKKPLKAHGLQLFQGKKILEIKDPRISKDAAIEPWLKRKHDFVLIIGDDFTDEDMFKVAPPEAYTIKVGRGRTAANYRLQSASDVKKLLGSLTK
jgi:trehalose 6-phosphate synthase/phosphatase